jgi:hypothetical protein
MSSPVAAAGGVVDEEGVALVAEPPSLAGGSFLGDLVQAAAASERETRKARLRMGGEPSATHWFLQAWEP